MSDSTNAVSRVLVVGGGISGLTVSTALRRKGVEVVLVELRGGTKTDGHVTQVPQGAGVAGTATGEPSVPDQQAPDRLKQIGHGITVQGNALKAFASIGVVDKVMENGYPFSGIKLYNADGSLMADIPTPPLGGEGLPSTCGALRSDLAAILTDAAYEAGVDIRTGTTVTAIDDHGDSVTATLSDGSTETVDLLIGADGIRSSMRGLLGIADEPRPVGMGIWRVVAKRPAEMTCSGMYYNGPKYKAGYTPISDDYCYAFLLEENLDREFVGEKANGHVMKEHGQGYDGIWGQVRDSIADDAIVNYQWIETICVADPWYRGRSVLIGDAVHACPPLIAQGAAMCAEDAVVLAELLTSGRTVEEALPEFMARRFPRVKMVLDNSLELADYEIHPNDQLDPGKLMGETLHALCEPA